MNAYSARLEVEFYDQELRQELVRKYQENHTRRLQIHQLKAILLEWVIIMELALIVLWLLR